MADKQTTAYCYVCGKQSRYVKPRINHTLHLILTILTIGIWGIVWLILGLSNSSKPVRCVTCGTAKGTGRRAAETAAAQGVGAPGTSSAAGWYPDPESPGRQRYWDGAAWTDHFHPPLVAADASVPSPADSPVPAAPSAEAEDEEVVETDDTGPKPGDAVPQRPRAS